MCTLQILLCTTPCAALIRAVGGNGLVAFTLAARLHCVGYRAAVTAVEIWVDKVKEGVVAGITGPIDCVAPWCMFLAFSPPRTEKRRGRTIIGAAQALSQAVRQRRDRGVAGARLVKAN